MSLGQELRRRNVIRMAGLDRAGARLIARTARSVLPIGAPDSDESLTRFAGVADVATTREESGQDDPPGSIKTPSGAGW